MRGDVRPPLEDHWADEEDEWRLGDSDTSIAGLLVMCRPVMADERGRDVSWTDDMKQGNGCDDGQQRKAKHDGAGNQGSAY